MKKWKLKDKINIDVFEFSKKNNCNVFLSKLLLSKYKNEEEALNFLNCEESLIDPFSIKDMDKAKNIILESIKMNKNILIFGDYDADGVTSTAFLYNYLKSIYKNVYYYIPDRFKHGYGLNQQSIDEILQMNLNIDLIITVDNGINAYSAVEYLNSLGIDVIITDHHIQSGDLPNAKAVVNPNRIDCKSEFKFFSGVGVVFKLVCALCENDYLFVLKHYSYFVCIGTISDLMPLVGENRFIVKYGLESFLDSENKGILQFIDNLNLFEKEYVSATDIAFLIAPRINAAGRMKHAYCALDLFLENDNNNYPKLYNKLNALNDERKNQELNSIDEIHKIISNDFNIINKDIIVIFKEGLNEGIIGLIASSISLKYNKPTIIFTNSTNNVLKGSARSAKGFDIFSAIKYCEDLLIGFGGHKFAAGISLNSNNLNLFIEKINNYYSKTFELCYLDEVLIDCEIDIEDVCLENIESLSILEPFGNKNTVPTFIIRNVVIKDIIALSEGKHTKFTLIKNNKTIMVNWFKKHINSINYIIGDKVDIVFSMSINYYNNNKYPSLSLIDIRISNLDESIFDQFYLLDKIKKNILLTEEEILNVLPDKNSISLVYKYIYKYYKSSSNFEKMFYKIGNKRVGYCKMILSLMVLKELNLIYEEKSTSKVLYKINNINEKVDIDSSLILKNLKLKGGLK